VAAALDGAGESAGEKMPPWDAFAAEIETSGLMAEHDAPKIVPVIHAINGDHVSADRAIHEELDRISNKDDM
jgi:hypothetical protein